jgi:hypothetical protein
MPFHFRVTAPSARSTSPWTPRQGSPRPVEVGPVCGREDSRQRLSHLHRGTPRTRRNLHLQGPPEQPGLHQHHVSQEDGNTIEQSNQDLELKLLSEACTTYYDRRNVLAYLELP